jgi:UDP:flavonoid glycosyltransferase YjiC (YdhE family)
VRVLLTPVGSAGDNLPFIGLGAELARRGHDVTVATTDHFAGIVRSCGLAFVSTGTEAEYQAAAEDPDIFHPRKGFPAVMKLVAEYNRRLFAIVTERQREGPLVVVAHTLDFASRVIADTSQLPVVRVHLQPTVVRTSHSFPVIAGTRDYRFLPRWLKRALWALIDRTALDPVAAPLVNELRARVGLAPARRVFVTQIDSPLLTIAMFPDWYAPPQPDWPASLRQAGFPLFDAPGSQGTSGAAVPEDVARFIDDGPPPIVFTPGSAMRFGHAFFEAGADACAGLGRRGLLLTHHLEHVPAPLPPDVAHFDYAPLSAVLPRCAALVHHGGIGTTAAALAAGVPQVIVPFSHDQPDNAQRVLKLGVGQRVMPDMLDAVRLAGALKALLASEHVARRCAEIAARCAARDGIGRACDLIESVIPGAKA